MDYLTPRYCYKKENGETGDTPPNCIFCLDLGFREKGDIVCEVEGKVVKEGATKNEDILAPSWCPLDFKRE